MTQNTLKPETLGAWVVHHGRKLQSDQRGPAEFSAIDGAAKGSLLLAGMASSDKADLSAKERLARKLNELVEVRNLSQGEVAELLAMSQPKVSAIRNYNLRGISLQRLMRALTALGQHVEIIVSPSGVPTRARIDVAAWY